ncbi:hypothetical protein BKA70DRAFT_478684 [Coprinopsis sp. MPI-PUGE-AT-0042]|nr:hypothetical protein BKA70DRAFT_478684 [Coprinopsis sp. MPI-PUGE-AT-0042]
MRLDLLQCPPLQVSPSDYEAGKKWIVDLCIAFEARDESRLATCVKEGASIQLSGHSASLSTANQRENFLRWFFRATVKHELIIHSIQVLPNQIVMDYDVEYIFGTAAETETVPFILTIDKSTKSPKANGIIISGDMSKVMPKLIAHARSPPPL